MIRGKAVPHAVSVAHGKESLDLQKVRDSGGITSEHKAALARASGLLAFHARLGTGDLKDKLDFASAFTWDAGGGTADANPPQPAGR